MSDANRTQVAIVEEATPGVTPTNPPFEILRTTGPGMSSSPNTTISSELRTDRQITDLIVVGIEATGELPMEASYGALDTIIRGGMMSEWIFAPVRDNAAAADGQISDVSATQYTIQTAAGVATNLNSGSFAAGHLIRATGFAVGGNNGLKRVTAATATTISAPGLAIEAAVPITARIKAVGFQGVAGDITATTVGGNALLATTLNFTTLGLVPGEWLKVGGTALAEQFGTGTNANNGWVRIAAISATRLDLDIVPTGWATDSGAGKTISVWMGDVIRNGTTRRTYGIELFYADLAVPEYDYYNGNHVGSLEWSGDAQSLLQFSASVMGFDVVNRTTAIGGSTYAPAPTREVMNTSTNVGELREGGALLSALNLVTSFSVRLDNTLRRRNAVGFRGSAAIGIGRAQVSGQLSTYYDSNAIRNKLLAGTASSFSARFTDPAGDRCAIIDLPRIKFEGGTPTVPGVDSDRMFEPSFRGLRHPTLGYSIQWQRVEEFQQ